MTRKERKKVIHQWLINKYATELEIPEHQISAITLIIARYCNDYDDTKFPRGISKWLRKNARQFPEPYNYDKNRFIGPKLPSFLL